MDVCVVSGLQEYGMKWLPMFWSMPPRARVQEALPSAFLELSDGTTGV